MMRAEDHARAWQKLADLRAGIEALADQWDKNAAADLDVESRTLRSVAAYLRALLDGSDA